MPDTNPNPDNNGAAPTTTDGTPRPRQNSSPARRPADPVDEVPAWEATPLEKSAERHLLGAMMTPLTTTRDGEPVALSSPAIIEARRIVEPEFFYDVRHQMIAAAVFALADAGVRGIDPVLVGQELARRDQLVKVGGPPVVHELFAQSITTANASHYADTVRAGYNRRATYAYAQGIAQVVANRDVESEDLYSRVTVIHERWHHAVSGAIGGNELVSVGNRGDVIADLLSTWGEPDGRGLSTGLHDLDTRINIAPGSLVIVAGRPGSGKSLLASQIAAHHVEELGVPVLFHSLEMPIRELVERDLARAAGVRLDSASGKTPLTAREQQRLQQAAHEYEQLGTLLFYDDATDLTIGHAEARYEEVAKITGTPPGLLVIDYVQLMKMNARAERRDIAVGEVSGKAKQFGLRTGCTVVLCAQLNRGPESRPNGVPHIADLRESGNLEQDADAVILVHPVGDHVEERQGEVDLIIAKQRRGGHNIVVPVQDYRAYAAFRNLTRRIEPARTAPVVAGVDMPDLDNLDHPDRNGPDWWDK